MIDVNLWHGLRATGIPSAKAVSHWPGQGCSEDLPNYRKFLDANSPWLPCSVCDGSKACRRVHCHSRTSGDMLLRSGILRRCEQLAQNAGGYSLTRLPVKWRHNAGPGARNIVTCQIYKPISEYPNLGILREFWGIFARITLSMRPALTEVRMKSRKFNAIHIVCLTISGVEKWGLRLNSRLETGRPTEV